MYQGFTFPNLRQLSRELSQPCVGSGNAISRDTAKALRSSFRTHYGRNDRKSTEDLSLKLCGFSPSFCSLFEDTHWCLQYFWVVFGRGSTRKSTELIGTGT